MARSSGSRRRWNDSAVSDPAWRIAPLTVDDADEVGTVHVEVWRQTYAGIMPADYLAGLDPRSRAASWRAAATNTTPVGAYRGAGRPEATQMLERILDIAADEIGVDPTELRRRNFIPPDRFPLTTLTIGATRVPPGRFSTAEEVASQAAAAKRHAKRMNVGVHVLEEAANAE